MGPEYKKERKIRGLIITVNGMPSHTAFPKSLNLPLNQNGRRIKL